MKAKTLLCLALVTSMLLGVVMIGQVSAPSTTIGVEPVEIIDPGLGPGSIFTVSIWVRGVVDLAGYEFKLGYDTAVLAATDITYGGIYAVPYELINVINDAEGYLHYSVMELTGVASFDGDGILAIITFTVDSKGASALDLYDTVLGDSAGDPIAHTAIDGYFSNVKIPPPKVPSATLARRSAWPEHHRYFVWKDEDDSNDLFAIVYNNGTVDTWVKVVFTITDATGIPVGEFETTTIPLEAGAIYGHKKDARYKTAFIPPKVGKYYVSAVCWVDTDGDTVPDNSMGKIKTFSFSVVP